MKHFTLVAALLVSCTIGAFAQTNSEVETPKPTLAIVSSQATILLMETVPVEPLKTSWVTDATGQMHQLYAQTAPRSEVPLFINSLDEHILTSFSDANQFLVVNRNDLNSMEREHEYIYHAAIHPATLPPPGNQTAAMYLLIVTIENYDDVTTKSLTNGQEVVNRELTIDAVAKIYDVTTGQLKNAVNVALTKGETIKDNSNESNRFMAKCAADFADEIATKVTARHCPFLVFQEPTPIAAANKPTQLPGKQ
jgi:curli biogenesis system outer membrane secretion channel CsgG